MEIVGVDVGASKVRIARVNPITGEITGDVKIIPTAAIKSNEQLTQLIASYLQEFGISDVGVSRPGFTNERGEVIAYNIDFSPLTFHNQLLNVGYKVTEEPDIESIGAAVKRWHYGEFHKAVVATFSSGFSYVLIENGEVRPSSEAGHQEYKPDSPFLCSCGHRGHREIFLGGRGAGFMAKQLDNLSLEHPIVKFSLADILQGRSDIFPLTQNALYALAVENIGGHHVYKAFAANPSQEPQKTVRELQLQAIADFFAYAASSHPDLEAIICTGGMTQSKKLLFEPAVYLFNEMSAGIPKPRIIVNQNPYFGVQGAALTHYMRTQNT